MAQELIGRWDADSRREVYWTGAGWTNDRDRAALMSSDEARRTAAVVGGHALGAWDEDELCAWDE